MTLLIRRLVLLAMLSGIAGSAGCKNARSPLKGRTCTPVLSENGVQSSECGSANNGYVCVAYKGATTGVCRQFDIESIQKNVSWKKAHEYCESKASDSAKWRLPTIFELQTLCAGRVFSDPPYFQDQIPGGDCSHLDSLDPMVRRESPLEWSSTCSTIRIASWFRELLWSLGLDHTMTSDSDCTVQSSGAAFVMAQVNAVVGIENVDRSEVNARCVREP